jgi:hypothetical protein
LAKKLSRFDCAMVLCDEKWMDPDEDMSNGYDDIRTQGDLLRLDSMVCLGYNVSHVSLLRAL